MDVYAKLVAISPDYQMQGNIYALSVEPDKIVLPSMEITCSDEVQTAGRTLFVEYVDLSPSFVHTELIDVRSIEGNIVMYYGAVIPYRTKVHQGHVINTGILEGKDLDYSLVRKLVNQL